MGTIFINVIEMSVAAAFLMIAVMLIRIPLKKAPKWFMGVLWAIVALRLVLPFQIESKIGLLPNIGEMIESNVFGTRTEVTYVTQHDYQPAASFNSGWVAGIDENETIVPEKADEEIEYLPNEEITVVSSYDPMTFRKDLFVRLQMIWMFGGLLVLGYAVFSYISIKKKTSASIKMDGSDNAYICDEIDTPFILGVFRPMIYLPSGLDDETVRNVLAHEKAHILRRDHIRKQFGFLLLALHWFNPLVWVSYALFCKDIELSCDEKVISHMSLDEKKSYATSLLLCSTHRRFVLAYPLAFGEVGVGTRVKQIFNYKKPTFWLIVMLAVVCAGLSTCFFTSAAGGDSDGAAGWQDEKEGTDAAGQNENSDDLAFNASNDESADDELAKNDSSGYKYTSSPQESVLSGWGTCFVDRDVDGIIRNSTKDVQTKLKNEGLLFMDGDSVSFGWSSPWPGMLHEEGQAMAMSYFTDEEKGEAEIHFYVADSEPHAYVWIEKLTIAEDKDGEYRVVKEHIDMYDEISSFEDLEDAYFTNGSDLEAIDYTKNKLGERLNNNAKEDTNGLYSQLFDPAASARYLLNLSDDESKVVVTKTGENSDGAVVTIKFVKENKFMDIAMIKPWGEDGIYIPKMQYPKDYYGNRSYELIVGDDEASLSGDDEASLDGNDTTSYVIVDEDGDDYYVNGDQYSTGLPAYIKGSGEKFVNLPFSNSDDYFEDVHEHRSMTDGYSEEADLNGDGKKEKIEVIDLGYNGGDGGYEPHVYNAAGKEIALPDDTRQEPFSLKWTDGNVEVMRGSKVIASLTKDQVHEFYLAKGYSEDKLEELEDIFNKDEVIVGDDASGFVITENNGKPELVVKYLLSGKQGHFDTFGYVLLHLSLNEEGTWNETPEFVTDYDPEGRS